MFLDMTGETFTSAIPEPVAIVAACIVTGVFMLIAGAWLAAAIWDKSNRAAARTILAITLKSDYGIEPQDDRDLPTYDGATRRFRATDGQEYQVTSYWWDSGDIHIVLKTHTGQHVTSNAS